VAELNAFAYRRGTSLLHRLDVRMKLVLMAAASLIALRLDFSEIGLMALSLAVVAAGCRRSLRIQTHELRWVGLLLGFVFFARLLSADGTTVFSIFALDISREGLQDGARISLRLALVFLIGMLLMATTRSVEIKAGVQWFLKLLPFIPAERVGTMLGLLVRFIPVIFEEISVAFEAQRARAVENRRNPLQRAVKLGLPTMSRVFGRSEQLALAMEARCYSELRTPPALKAVLKDWVLFMAGCIWLASLLVL
jgi:energy-coupling factor transporter transmembrane protein EcfT